MKRTMVLVLLVAMLALTACGQTSPAAETPQGGQGAAVANPWRDVTEAEAAALCPRSFVVPEGAENAHWSVMETAGESALVQLSFDLNGMSFTAREKLTGDSAADISGMCYTWTEQIKLSLRSWAESAKSGAYSRYIGEGEWADLCAWYDTEEGVSYSLSVTAKDLDGFDLQAIAEELSPSAAAATGRQDGERFEAVIILEGMEETVPYEHIRNEALGFEMDYDYERFARQSEAERELFISLWEARQDPENYLELTRSAEDVETVAASVRAALSEEYDLLESTRELEGAGECIYIEASVLKGTNTMADQLQVVYLIPAPDGCRVATAHFTIETAEGIGRRISYMMNTLRVIG